MTTTDRDVADHHAAGSLADELPYWGWLPDDRTCLTRRGEPKNPSYVSIARSKAPMRFGSMIEAKCRSVGGGRAPRRSPVGSRSARPVAMAYRKTCPQFCMARWPSPRRRGSRSGATPRAVPVPGYRRQGAGQATAIRLCQIAARYASRCARAAFRVISGQTQREPLFLAADPVSPAPLPSARGANLQVKTATVEQLACSGVLYGSLSNQVRPMYGSGTGNRTPVPWLRTTYPNP